MDVINRGIRLGKTKYFYSCNLYYSLNSVIHETTLSLIISIDRLACQSFVRGLRVGLESLHHEVLGDLAGREKVRSSIEL
ncbi:LOW QUALITY PROTEIN: hypothetical protein V1477_010612 [Vespula maculifrons]|uniref:Uncharacterized protein n=1 Tax=Vespula maculifrons TaxID=7453 RepID=A0ABD2C2E5_VESMC